MRERWPPTGDVPDDGTNGGDHGHDYPLRADGGVSEDVLLRVLASRRNRYVLEYLREKKSARLEELSRQVAAREGETRPSKVDDRTIDDVSIELYHVQIPKLEDVGLVEFDVRSRAVRYREPPTCFEPILDTLISVESCYPDRD